jgi:hypothetical protein
VSVNDVGAKSADGAACLGGAARVPHGPDAGANCANTAPCRGPQDVDVEPGLPKETFLVVDDTILP